MKASSPIHRLLIWQSYGCRCETRALSKVARPEERFITIPLCRARAPKMCRICNAEDLKEGQVSKSRPLFEMDAIELARRALPFAFLLHYPRFLLTHSLSSRLLFTCDARHFLALALSLDVSDFPRFRLSAFPEQHSARF